jgi:hypothetical protein
MARSSPLTSIYFRDQEWWNYTSAPQYASIEWCVINYAKAQLYLIFRRLKQIISCTIYFCSSDTECHCSIVIVLSLNNDSA